MLTLKKYYWYRKAKKLLEKADFREGCIRYLREKAEEDLAQAEADFAEAESQLDALQEAATTRLLEQLNILEDACAMAMHPPMFDAEFTAPLFDQPICTDPTCDICSQAQLDEELAEEQEEEINWSALDFGLEDRLLEEAQGNADRSSPNETWTVEASDVWTL